MRLGSRPAEVPSPNSQARSDSTPAGGLFGGQTPNPQRPNPPAAPADSASADDVESGEPADSAEAAELATPVAGDEEGPATPSEADEAAFLAEARDRGERVRPVTRETIEEVEEKTATLPKLDDLVNRIPADVRDTLDELFRARFVAVRRVPRKALKK
jgi:hypothetical protein